jgi:hypothetical protein
MDSRIRILTMLDRQGVADTEQISRGAQGKARYRPADQPVPRGDRRPVIARVHAAAQALSMHRRASARGDQRCVRRISLKVGMVGQAAIFTAFTVN